MVSAMRDEEIIDYERRAYERRRKTRNELRRTRRMLTVSYIVWAITLVAVLVIGTMHQLEEADAREIHTSASVPFTPPVWEPVESVEPIDAVAEVEEAEKDWTSYNKVENVTLTHYCICKKCCGKDEDHPAYGITANGRTAEPYVSVAVDPALIPLGSEVYVDYGDGDVRQYRADDTGVAGAHIDLCVEGHQEALNLGVMTVTAYWK